MPVVRHIDLAEGLAGPYSVETLTRHKVNCLLFSLEIWKGLHFPIGPYQNSTKWTVPFMMHSVP